MKRKRPIEDAKPHKRSKHRNVKNQNLRARLIREEKISRNAKAQAKVVMEHLASTEPGFLEPESSMEKTYKVSQEEIVEAVDLQSKKKVFELHLAKFGPYRSRYSRNGSHLLLTGGKGHVAVIDWRKLQIVNQIQLNELVLDSCFLHDHQMYALAHSDHVYIYDQHGTEIHILKKHRQPTRLEFLPYHFLLASVTKRGFLNYQDTSTGEVVNCIKTKMGPCSVMCQNPYNAAICLGHGNGVVSMWIPSMGKAAAKILSHRGPVRAVAVHRNGRYMATAGADGKMKIWDIRKFGEVHSYNSHKPATSLAISDANVLAAGIGQHLEVWKDPFSTKQHRCYMKHMIPSSMIQTVRFCPFEDVLGIGHVNGFQSILIPGSGNANFDSKEVNPFATNRELNRSVVHKLLDKLQPAMIQLDPDFVGSVSKFASQPGEKSNEVKEMKKKNKQRTKYRTKIKRNKHNVQTRKESEMKSSIKNEQQKRLKKIRAAERKFQGKATDALERFR